MGGLWLQLPSFQDQGVGSPGPYSRELLPGSFALSKLKVAANTVPGECCAPGVEQEHGCSEPCRAGSPQVWLLPSSMSQALEWAQSHTGLYTT